MIKTFFTTTNPTAGLQAAVFATGVYSPMDALEDIERELSERKVFGKVLFDLLLTNGNKTNRYFVGEFDGRSFDRNAIQLAMSKYEAFSRISASVFKSHFAEVDTILLTKAMRFALKQGIPM